MAIAFGIDIGGSGVKGAPVDLETGEFTQERFRIETPIRQPRRRYPKRQRMS